MKYKKKRSKSCMNKSENIFLKIPIPSAADKDLKRAKRDKSNENNKTSVLSGLLERSTMKSAVIVAKADSMSYLQVQTQLPCLL